MHTLMKIVVSQGSGIIREFGKTDIQQENIVGHIATISERIEGHRLTIDDLGEDISYIHHFARISSTAAIVVLQIQFIEMLDVDAFEQQVHYTRYQVLFLQIDAESLALRWKHLISFDSRGAASHLSDAELEEGFSFDCNCSLQHTGSANSMFVIALSWHKQRLIAGSGHRKINFYKPVYNQLVRVMRVTELPPWDIDEHIAVYEATLYRR